MPSIASSIPVAGTVVPTSSGQQLILFEKLTSVDTFLSGTLDLDGHAVRVRILTLDDVTVLQPVDDLQVDSGDWTGTLNVSHGQRPGKIPGDLRTGARQSGRDVTALGEADLRYALTFLGEATTPDIRAERIAAVVTALPRLPRRLITLDVGGTLGQTSGRGITSVLLDASPLEPRQVRRAVREVLHTAEKVSDSHVRDLSVRLHISPDEVNAALDARAAFVPYAETAEILAAVSTLGTVVTLSNASRAESPIEEMRGHFSQWVDDFFPSWRIGRSKPDPRAFTTVADLCGHDVAQVVHVGDDWDCDVVGAVDAGARAIWISGGRTTPDTALAESDRVQIVCDLAQVAPAITNESRWSTS